MLAAADQSWTRYARGNVARPVLRRRFGVRGLRGFGQVDCTSLDSNGNCVTSTGAIYDQSGNLISGSIATQVGTTTTFNTTNPVVQQSTGTLLNPGSAVDVNGSPYGAIGSSGGCAAGYVVADASGNCAPTATVAATLSTAAGAASLGLTATQQAAALASINAATAAAKILSGQPAVTPVVASTNPFASISTTTLMIGAAVILGVLVISKKR